MIVYYGARFDHVAAPARPIVGTVRDKDTGAPIPGVHITGMPEHPQQPGHDARHRGDHRRTGPVPGRRPARRARVQALHRGAAGQPYVNWRVRLPGGEPGPGPFTFDMTLKRGVLVRGRLTDKATGRPLHGSVKYLRLPGQPAPRRVPELQAGEPGHAGHHPGRRRPLRDPGPAGPRPDRRPGDEDGYLHGVGAAAIKGFDKELGAFATYPYYCIDERQARLRRDQPAPGTKELTLILQVDPGRTVKGTIVDPDGSAHRRRGRDPHASTSSRVRSRPP